MCKKPVIVYCDDKQSWLDRFRGNHSNRFDIRDTTEGTEFLKILEEMNKQGTSPDIILIDLFHPKHNDPEEQKKWDVPGTAAIDQLENAIKEAKGPIYDAWAPLGLEMLEHARRWHPNTPIAIYTQQGVSVVDDSGLVKVAELKGEWMLKGRQAVYETSRLLNMLENSKIEKTKMAEKIKKEVTAEIAKHYTALTRKVLWFLAAVIFTVPIIYSWISGQGFYNTLSIGATLASLFIAIVSLGVPYIERYSQKAN